MIIDSIIGRPMILIRSCVTRFWNYERRIYVNERYHPIEDYCQWCFEILTSIAMSCYLSLATATARSFRRLIRGMKMFIHTDCLIFVVSQISEIWIPGGGFVFYWRSVFQSEMVLHKMTVTQRTDQQWRFVCVSCINLEDATNDSHSTVNQIKVKKLFRVFSCLLRSSRFQHKLKDDLRRGVVQEERVNHQYSE